MSRIPEGWNIMKVKEIAQKNRSAMSTGPFGSSISAKYFVDEGIPVIRGGNLSNKHEIRFVDRNFVFISRDKAKEFERSAVYQHDLIFTCWGTINQVGLIPNDSKYPFYIISNKQMKLTVDKSKFSSEYIYNLFSSGPIQKQIKRRSIGSSVPGFNLIQLKQIKLLIPTIQEQSKIAKILATWDKAINTTQVLIDVSNQQKKALMQQLLTGKKRFPEFRGKWKYGVFNDLANIDSGFSFKSTDFTNESSSIPIIRMSDLKLGKLDLDSVARVSMKVIEGLERFALKEQNFLFGLSGSLSNYAWVKINDLPCYLNQRVGRIVVKPSADQMFVTYAYLSDRIQHNILNKAAGAAQLNISVTDLRIMPIKYPALKEQQKISSLLTSFNYEIDVLQQKLACLKHEKRALMQQLLTGKRRVKIDKTSISDKGVVHD